jgi:hypothetical protein
MSEMEEPTPEMGISELMGREEIIKLTASKVLLKTYMFTK